MQYLYLHNVRGFAKTFVPIEACNFLVGENSTGKSSFLSILRTATSYDFLFQPKFTLGDEDTPAAFSDLVSAWSETRSSFDVGILYVEKRKNGKYDVSYSIQRFADSEGRPRVVQLVHSRDKRKVHLRFAKAGSEYIVHASQALSTPRAGIAAFKRAVRELDNSRSGFKRFPRDFPSFPPAALALSLVSSLEPGARASSIKEFKIELPFAQKLTWFAPIRTRPKRIYHGISKGYSVEGEHTPFVIRQRLKSKQFVDTLREFGKSSGLFEVVSTHTFGKGRNNPFEVLIRLNGRSFNIENVGYGVSQALPLIVEFLSGSDSRTFVVQQPEVHLHPRAQAALGSLLYQLASEKSHRFTVETHSDYLIDRFRLTKAKGKKSISGQVLFFYRSPKGNKVTPLEIDENGRYPGKQPPQFRDFFIREELQLFSL